MLALVLLLLTSARPASGAAGEGEADVRTFTPARVREIVLCEPAASGIRNVLAFGFDAESRLRFVRSEDDGGALVRLDSGGRVLSATPVATDFAVGRELAWFPLAPPQWLVVVASWEERPGQAWCIDEASGVVEELLGFPAGDVERVLPLDAARWLVHFGTAAPRVYDAAGDRAEPLGSLRDADDLAVTSSGRIVALHGIGNAPHLRVWRADGSEEGSVDLAKAWGRPPRRATAIVADADDGVIVHDFGGTSPLVRMDLDGRVSAELDARMPDGTARADYRRHLAVAPDGRLWTTDGHDLVRLGTDGTADRALRGPARADVLEAPWYGAIDTAFGRVMLQDTRTRSLHVFDASGAHVLACRTRSEELEELAFPLTLSVTSDGGVLAAARASTDRPVRFGPDGMSRGIVELTLFGAAFVPGRDAYWGWRRWRPARLGPDGTVEVELPHRVDGERWRSIERVAVSPAGELAVLELPRRQTKGVAPYEPGRAVIALFDADGAPRAQHELPEEVYPSRLAYAGPWVLAHNFGWSPWLLDARDGVATKLELESELDPAYPSDLGLAPAGDELWILHPARGRLRAYTLPE